MPTPTYNARLHRIAQATPVIALVTVTAGALVTSKHAGMAFRDWPTSDGYTMVTYPWFRDFAANWDKFLEHGHRLAGMSIGIWSIVLACLLWKYEPRRWVKLAGLGILLAVCIQGVLGGFRVQLDQRGLAMVHGAFAACVLSLMAGVATAMSRNWMEAPQRFASADVGLVKPAALLTVGLLAMQFLLGGLIRHGGTGLQEHLVMGIVTFVFIVLGAVLSHFSGVRWIRRSGWLLLLVALLQVSLGGCAWVAKYGYAPAGYVAVADSIHQVFARTAHTVVGILLFMTGVVHAVRVLRVDAVSAREPEPVVVRSSAIPGGAS